MRDEEPREEPRPDPEPARRSGSVGPLLCLGAAVLTVIGSILDLITAQNFPGPGAQQTISFTSWTTDIGGVDDGLTQPIPLNGVPLMGAAALLLAAAVLWMLAANRSLAARLRSLVALVTAVGVAFLAGAVTTIGVQMLWWMDLFVPPGEDSLDGPTVTVGPGFWMLVVGVALAAAATGLAWRQRRPDAEPTPGATDTADTAEVPAGEPVVSVRRLPDAPPDDPPPAQGS